MKKLVVISSVLVLVLSLAAIGLAKPRIYKWVKDNRTSSDDLLSKAQSSRVVSTSESQAEKIIKNILTKNLHLSLAKYHTTRHQQDAETTADSVLPEEVIRQEQLDLIDEDYRFILEIKTKRIGNRTRVMAKAWPVYRLRDTEAEDARDNTSESGNTVELKIRSEHPSAIGLGPIIVAPIMGLPADYGISPLPDAADRATALVKAFIYYLDSQVKELKQEGSVAEPKPAAKAEETAKTENTTAPAPEAQPPAGTEVDIKIQTGK